MGKLSSFLDDEPCKGRSYTIIRPQNSLQMKVEKPASNNMNTRSKEDHTRKKTYGIKNQGSIAIEQNMSTSLKNTATSCKNEPGNCIRGNCSYRSSWRSLKNLLLSPCDLYRCPRIKQRMEVHQQGSHKKCNCSKNNTPGSTQRKRSRVSIRSGPEYDQYSDQSLPTSERAYNMNVDNSSINNENVNKGCTSKCRDTCKKLKSNLVKSNYDQELQMNQSNKDKIYTDGLTSTHDIQKINKEDVKKEKLAIKYTDTYTTPSDTDDANIDNSNITENKENDSINTNKPQKQTPNTRDNTTDSSEKIEMNNYLTEAKNQPLKFVEGGTSPINFDNDKNITNNYLDEPKKRKCSRECTTNTENNGFFSDNNRTSPNKSSTSAFTTQIDSSVPKEKKDYSHNPLIVERPLCADIYTTTYRDNFTDPFEVLNFPPTFQKLKLVQHNNDKSVQSTPNIAESTNSNRNQCCTSTNCNINIYDIPTNDNHSNCAVQADDDSTENSEYNNKESYTTTYRDAYTGFLENLKFPIVRGNCNIIKDDNKQARVNSEEHAQINKKVPCISRNFDHSTCNLDFCSTASNSRSVNVNDNVPNELPKSHEKSTCCDFATSTCCNKLNSSYLSERDEQPKCTRENVNRSTLYSYKTLPNALDDVYDICTSKTKLALKKCRNGCKENSDHSLILKEVNEWFYEVPMYDALEKECFDNIISDLVNNLSRLSKNFGKPGYDEQVRNEINLCLDRIPIWYPGAIREQAIFKRSLVNSLVLKLNILHRKDTATGIYSISKEVCTSLSSFDFNFNNSNSLQDYEIQICVTEWLRLVYSKANHIMDNHIPQLVDFVLVRIKPLLNIPVNTYNQKIILKSAIVNIINDLPVATNCPRNNDVQIYNFAKNLAESLLCIQDKYANGTKQQRVTTTENLKTNYFKPVKKREKAICSEIRKCFDEVNIDYDNLLIEEASVILLDCFDIRDPKARQSAQEEIINLILNSVNITDQEASQLTEILMKKTRKLLNEEYGGVRKMPHNIFNPKKRCTVLVCRSIKEVRPINYYLAYTRKCKPKKKDTGITTLPQDNMEARN